MSLGSRSMRRLEVNGGVLDFTDVAIIIVILVVIV